MKIIHRNIERNEDIRNRQTLAVDIPRQKNEIHNIQDSIEQLRMRINIEREEGVEHVERLASEITHREHKINEIMQRMHFPSAPYVMGSDGLYVGFNDIWVETISGKLQFEIIQPTHTHAPGTEPQPSKLRAAFLGNDGGGLTIKLKVTDFRLKSEVSTIPSVTLRELRLDIVAKIDIILTYVLDDWKKDQTMGHWDALPRDFKFELLTFRSPLAISNSILVALIKPQVMKFVRDIYIYI